MAIKVVLVDDHRMLIEFMRLYFERSPDITVVGEAQNGREAMQIVDQTHPDIVVLDAVISNLNGIDFAEQLHQRCPNVRTIVLTAYRDYLHRAFKVGVNGYLLKNLWNRRT